MSRSEIVVPSTSSSSRGVSIKDQYIILPELTQSFENNLIVTIDVLGAGIENTPFLNVSPQESKILTRHIGSTILQLLPFDIISIIFRGSKKYKLVFNGTSKLFPTFMGAYIEKIVARLLCFKYIFLQRLYDPSVRVLFNVFRQHEDQCRTSDDPFSSGLVYFMNDNFNMFFTILFINIAINNYTWTKKADNLNEHEKRLQSAYKQMAKYIDYGVYSHNMFVLLERQYLSIAFNDSLIDEKLRDSKKLTKFECVLIQLCSDVKNILRGMRDNIFSEIYIDQSEYIATIYGRESDYKRNIALYTLLLKIIFEKFDDPTYKKHIDYFFGVCTILGIDIWHSDKYIDSFKNNGKDYFLEESCYKADTSVAAHVGFTLYVEIIDTIMDYDPEFVKTIDADMYAENITGDLADMNMLEQLYNLRGVIGFFKSGANITPDTLAYTDPHVSIFLALKYYFSIDNGYRENHLSQI
jgi:hypothetical protein